jgi:hypothetical protein
MATDAFDAFEEEFFREGERLGDERTEDFSDLDAPAATLKAPALRLPARPPRPPGALAHGTPPPELVAPPAAAPEVAPRAHRLRRPPAIALALTAAVFTVGAIASVATSSDQRALAGSVAAPAPAQAVVAPPPAPPAPPAPPPAVDAPAIAAPAAAPAPEPAADDDAPPSRKRLTPSQRRDRAEAAYAKGRTAFMSGDYRQAVRHFRRAVDVDPKLAKGHRAMGLAYQKLGDRPRAIRAFRAYLRADPKAKDAKAIQKRIAGTR